jgi:predicted MPP superfamily phosphohydrolase
MLSRRPTGERSPVPRWSTQCHWAQDVDDRAKVKRSTHRLITLGAAVVVLSGLVIAVGLREAIAEPEIRRLEVALPGWPAGQRSLTVALLSDVHLGNRAMDARRLNSIVDQVNGARPDLVLIAGDFVVGQGSQVGAARAAGLQKPLSRLLAPMGVIAVLGNHDHWTAPGAVRKALADAGITVLTNRAIRRGPLAVIGVDDSFSHHEDVAAAISSWKQVGGLPILFTHSPDLAHRLGPDIPLVMAGHTHCGQVVLPWIGPLLSRSPRQHWRPLYDARYRCGVVREAGRTIVVTAGLGSGSSPIRLGAPPDWWLIQVGPSLDVTK